MNLAWPAPPSPVPARAAGRSLGHGQRAAALLTGVFAILVAVLPLRPALAADNVAVAVFSADPALKKFERAAQSRLESVLADSGLAPLDEARARELRDNWVDLADPGHLVTAEEIAEKAGRYDVKRVYRLSFTVDATRPLGLYHSAAAQVQLRVIDREARVSSHQSLPMGTRGFAASDAATPEAAMVNALQRAVDSVAEAAGLQVLAPATARSINLQLVPVPALPPGAEPLAQPAAEAPAGWEGRATLLAERWRREEPSCRAVSPDGGYGVLGTYAWSLDRLARDNARRYGGYLHLVDLRAAQPVVQLTLHELGQRGAGESGSSAALACQFLGSWRHLLAASGNRLACFDVERGRETCSIALPQALAYEPGRTQLRVLQAAGEGFVELASGDVRAAWRIGIGR
jgi:hypothetical protein